MTLRLKAISLSSTRTDAVHNKKALEHSLNLEINKKMLILILQTIRLSTHRYFYSDMSITASPK